MATRNIPVQTIGRREFNDGFDQLRGEVARREIRVVIEEDGEPVVAVVPISDLKRLQRLDRERAARLDAIAVISDAVANVPLEELEAQLARIAAEGPNLDDEKPERKLA